MRVFIIAHLILSCLSVRATHIVGGEFQLINIDSSYNYEINLILYFDNINGNPAAEDFSTNVAIYENATGALMEQFTIPSVSNTELIEYNNPYCQESILETRIIKYSTNKLLSPAIYDDSSGYYLVWERCCRNGIIQNINNPGGAGMVFYLKFPPVTQGGFFYKNSSPVIVPPFSDFVCIDQHYTFDFSASDDDGDSLVYSMVTPYNGTSSVINIIPNPPQPKPWSNVVWLSGFSEDNQVSGNPELRIDSITGELSITPSQEGLHVFAVLIEEYRGGLKIGELRRDYQMLVLPPCYPNKLPTIDVWNPNTNDWYVEGETIIVNPDDDRCFEVFATDSSDEVTIYSDKLQVLDEDLSFNDTTGTIADETDTLQTSFCWDKCADSETGYFEIDLIAADSGTNGCVEVSADTMRVNFIVAPIFQDNTIPTINVFTPNGDGVNDGFTIPDLPEDLCDDAFLRVEVYNRWGKLVFIDENIDFSWEPEGNSEGLYYYSLFYEKRITKGWLQLIR